MEAEKRVGAENWRRGYGPSREGAEKALMEKIPPIDRGGAEKALEERIPPLEMRAGRPIPAIPLPR